MLSFWLAGKKYSPLFRSEVARHLGFVGEAGFGDPEFKVWRDPLLGQWFQAKFLAPRRELVVDAIYGHATDPRAVKRHMTLFRLLRDPERRPDEPAEMDDRLEGNDYIERERPDLRATLDGIMTLDRSFPDVIRMTLPLYAELLRRELRPILTGERWAKGYWSTWD